MHSPTRSHLEICDLITPAKPLLLIVSHSQAWQVRRRTYLFTVHPTRDSDSQPSSGDTCRLQTPGPQSRDSVTDDPRWDQGVKCICGLLCFFLLKLPGFSGPAWGEPPFQVPRTHNISPKQTLGVTQTFLLSPPGLFPWSHRSDCHLLVFSCCTKVRDLRDLHTL